MAYVPPQEILDKYADVLVNHALNGGKGVKAKEVVQIQVPECAKPLLISLYKAVLKAGAYPISQLIADGMGKMMFEHSSDDQLKFFPAKYLRGMVDQVDHSISIIAETNKKELEGVAPAKIMMRHKAFGLYRDWRVEKENLGKFTWTLALYGTEEMAKEVKMSIDEYWEQIILACYLDKPNPVQVWQGVMSTVEELTNKLDALKIEKLHIKSANTDLIVGLGKNRKWMGGTGRNIPSFEVFISPDWRLTEGHIQFTEPLYRYGNLITGVRLEFKNGKVVKATAKTGEHIVKEMIAAENADKIGECSLTDSRLSRITKFMGETLFDENVGGVHGNTHVAVGSAYKDSYPGDPSKITKEQWVEMGYNDSVVHTDIVSTENRVVTAYLPDGTTKVIYKDGKFTI